MSRDALPTHIRILAPAFLDPSPEPDLPETAPAAATEPAPDRAADGPSGTEPEPPGKALADVIAHGLAERGWEIAHRWVTYTGHAFEARRAPSRYDVELELLPEPTPTVPPRGLWRVVAKPRAKFFQRLFASGVDLDELALLRMHVEASLDHDPRTAPTAGGRGRWRAEREDLALAPDALGE